MLLQDWLKKEGIPAYKFAKRIGIGPTTIYKSLSGTQRLSARYAVLIERETNGECSRAELIWPEDHVDGEADGSQQTRMFPKIR